MCEFNFIEITQPPLSQQFKLLQSRLPEILPKIATLRAMFNAINRPEVHISVDGGINTDTGRQVIAKGASVLVAGKSVYGASDLAQAIQDLKHTDCTKALS